MSSDTKSQPNGELKVCYLNCQSHKDLRELARLDGRGLRAEAEWLIAEELARRPAEGRRDAGNGVDP